MNKKNSKIIKKLLPITIVLGLFLYITPFLYRIMQNQLSFPDTFSYYYLLKGPSLPLFLYYVASLLAGILILFFTYHILLAFFWKKTVKTMVVFLLMSPVFVFLGNSFVRPLFYLLLLSGGFYLITRKKQLFHILGFCILLLTVFIGYEAVLTSLLLLVYASFQPAHKRLSMGCATAILFSLLFVPNPMTFSVTTNLFQQNIVEFGSMQGMLVAHFFLAFVGLFILWRKKYSFISLFAMFIVIALFSQNFHFFSVYLSIIASILSGFVFYQLIKREWEYIIIKYISLIALVLMILLSHVTYVWTISTEAPNQEYLDILSELQTYKRGIVFANPKNAYLVQYYSDKQPLFYPGDINPVIEQLYSSQLITQTIETFEQNQVSYILVDNTMKRKDVEVREGLLYVLTDINHFTQLLEKDTAELYYFKS